MQEHERSIKKSNENKKYNSVSLSEKCKLAPGAE